MRMSIAYFLETNRSRTLERDLFDCTSVDTNKHGLTASECTLLVGFSEKRCQVEY